jgi:hypothetical protein
MDKYNAFTFVKWIYLFGFLMVLPGWSQFEAVDWAVVPMHIYWKIGLSWLFQPCNLFVKPDHYERIKPTTVAVFIYFSLSSLFFLQLV